MTLRAQRRVVPGEPELNCWCAVCQLPTRLRVPLHINGPGTVPAGVLEICPGCGTGHDKPSVTVAAAPRQPRTWHPLTSAVRAVHRWACRRRGLVSRVCAQGDCPLPGLYRHEHTILGDEGTWRYVFCSRRHRQAWASENGIHLPDDRGNAG